MKNRLIGKDPDAGKDWRQEEKGTIEDEMVGWHHRLDGHEFEQAPGVVMDSWGAVLCAAVHGVAKSQTWLSDWTEPNTYFKRCGSFIRRDLVQLLLWKRWALVSSLRGRRSVQCWEQGASRGTVLSRAGPQKGVWQRHGAVRLDGEASRAGTLTWLSNSCMSEGAQRPFLFIF